ncbi:MAG: hypothetical protein KJ062_18145, partial [Thermoanaerobaculia bacterium]|nr:hypothetical protein [Thermoanaerobaculia bacterium]
LTVLRSGPDAGAAGSATVAVAQANGDSGLTPADRDDDELLRSVDSLLSTESPYGSLLPEAIR